MSDPINSFQDLRVYQEACELDLAAFEVSQRCPREELAALGVPLRHAARSVGAAIAGAWPKRRSPEEFVARLTDADAALQETRHWLGRAAAAGYLDATRQADLEAGCDGIGRKLGALMKSAQSAKREALGAEREGQGGKRETQGEGTGERGRVDGRAWKVDSGGGREATGREAQSADQEGRPAGGGAWKRGAIR